MAILPFYFLNSLVMRRTSDFSAQRAIFKEAHAAGMASMKACSPTPMVVGSPSTPLGNDVDPTKPTYFIEGGVCGFASVIFSGRGKFAKFMKDNKLARKHYYGGYSYWVSEGGQSLQRKEAYARAFARVLNEHGIKGVYVDSRMD